MCDWDQFNTPVISPLLSQSLLYTFFSNHMMLVFDEEHPSSGRFQFFFAGVPMCYFDIERQMQHCALDMSLLTHTHTHLQLCFFNAIYNFPEVRQQKLKWVFNNVYGSCPPSDLSSCQPGLCQYCLKIIFHFGEKLICEKGGRRRRGELGAIDRSAVSGKMRAVISCLLS